MGTAHEAEAPFPPAPRWTAAVILSRGKGGKDGCLDFQAAVVEPCQALDIRRVSGAALFSGGDFRIWAAEGAIHFFLTKIHRFPPICSGFLFGAGCIIKSGILGLETIRLVHRRVTGGSYEQFRNIGECL